MGAAVAKGSNDGVVATAVKVSRDVVAAKVTREAVVAKYHEAVADASAQGPNEGCGSLSDIKLNSPSF